MFVRSFETLTLPKLRFWSGLLFKTSDEIAFEGGAETISFEVLNNDPFQNLGFGGVGVSKL